MEKAASTRHAAHFRSLDAAQGGLFLITCFQFIATTPKPVWFWRVGSLDGIHVAVEAATCNGDIYPSELPMGLSMFLSRGPHSLLAAHWQPGVEPPRMCSSFIPCGPRATGPISVQSRELPSRWTAVGLSTFQSWSPHPLSAAFCGPVSSSLHVHVPDPKLLL